jgi:hypothetical protein
VLAKLARLGHLQSFRNWVVMAAQFPAAQLSCHSFETPHGSKSFRELLRSALDNQEQGILQVYSGQPRGVRFGGMP